MDFLLFEDDELEMMHEVVNKLQLCFHPTYAPNGHFTAHDLFELQDDGKQVIIIADRNIISPICEIATNGMLNNEYRMWKIALFVTWAKFTRVQLSSGLGLYESDSSGLASTTGEENRMQFLHGVNTIPSQIWKALAYGQIDKIPECYLYKRAEIKDVKYDFNDNFLYLSNEAAIIKITLLLKTQGMSGIDKFVDFMNWYTDHLDIAESIMVYAAMVFTNTPNVDKPKGCLSKDYDKAVAGIRNQAWDLTYIVAWSMRYRNESGNNITMFATDDITQKSIVVNVIPPGQCEEALNAVFDTKAARKKLEQLINTKLGAARVRPFENMSLVQKEAIVKKLVKDEYHNLMEMYT